jgi:hypothetical protein
MFFNFLFGDNSWVTWSGEIIDIFCTLHQFFSMDLAKLQHSVTVESDMDIMKKRDFSIPTRIPPVALLWPHLHSSHSTPPQALAKTSNLSSVSMFLLFQLCYISLAAAHTCGPCCRRLRWKDHLSPGVPHQPGNTARPISKKKYLYA